MARSESSLTKSDNWNLNGLVNPDHPMKDWAERRVRGILTAELTEAVRLFVGENLLSFVRVKGQFSTEERAKIKKFLEDEANAAVVDIRRSELRASAQAEFDSGTYGAGTRGPIADPPRVAAILAFIVSLFESKGLEFPMPETRDGRIEAVADFEKSPVGRKYRREIEAATAHLVVKPKIDFSMLEQAAN